MNRLQVFRWHVIWQQQFNIVNDCRCWDSLTVSFIFMRLLLRSALWLSNWTALNFIRFRHRHFHLCALFFPCTFAVLAYSPMILQTKCTWHWENYSVVHFNFILMRRYGVVSSEEMKWTKRTKEREQAKMYRKFNWISKFIVTSRKTSTPVFVAVFLERAKRHSAIFLLRRQKVNTKKNSRTQDATWN